MTTEFSFQTARPENRTALVSLLQTVNLPVEDLPQSLDYFLLAEEKGQVRGSVGLDIYGSCALLRSLAVLGEKQGTGLGKALYQAAAGLASRQGVRDLYLITTTASGFFARQGFEQVARENVPEAIRNTMQFRDVCPASATVMHRQLV
jgi:amino-acid N-acetyltransferase